jgi:hypothetical protein
MEPGSSLLRLQQSTTGPNLARWIQFMSPNPVSLRSTFDVILSSMPGLLSDFYQSGFSTKILYAFHAAHALLILL